MGSKKLLNTSSSPPIAYKRYSNNCEEQKPLQQQQPLQQHSNQQQQMQQQQQPLTGNHKHSNNTTNTTCLPVKHNTNTMFTKLRNFFTQFRTKSTSALSAASQRQRKRHHHQHYRHEKLTECNSIPIVQCTSSALNLVYIVVTLVFLASINGVTSNPVFVDDPSLAQFQSGRNIRHLPCIVRKSSRSGICMFAIDCIKQNGTHLGTCIDRFYFGSCCDIKVEELTEIADNSIDQNTISHHFTPDASTVPSSSLFSPLYSQDNSSITSITSSSSIASQNNITEVLNSVTQSLFDTSSKDTPRPTSFLTSSNTGMPSRSTSTTAKPNLHTTHKQSHFVIRTTAKPTKYTTGSKPSHNTTIKKKTTSSTTTKKTTTVTSPPTTTTTTTPQPLLTTAQSTAQREEFPLEATTPPPKLFTYQIVETTAFTPTEATNMFDFVTTERMQQKPSKYSQTINSIPTTTTHPKATTTKPTTIRSTTEALVIHKITTLKPKPQTTRKPTTTKKPTSSKRTTVKPTKRPVSTTRTTTTTEITPTNTKIPNNATTEAQSFSTTTTIQQANKTTLAPRPRPKPTANIIKVSKPATSTSTKPTSTSTTTISSTSTTAAEAEEIVTSSSTSTTKKPIPTVPSTTTTTTTTTPKTTATTTHKTIDEPELTSTTHKPGLVTWTNIDGVPVDLDKPIISDWVPVTGQSALNTHNNIQESSSENVTFEEIDVSVSSSVSAVMNNNTIIISPPQKPVVILKPTTTTTTTTASTTTTAGSTTTVKPPTSSYSPTEPPTESSTAAQSSSQLTTESLTPSTTTITTSSTAEVTTENFNFNFNSTTSTPINGIEGVDFRQVCGRRMFPEPRIVGGSNAAFGRWPWQISLRQWRTSTYLHKCGAALLNENWAITAAHCVDNVPPSDLLLRLGEYDLAEEEEPYGYQERRVQIVASHPQFDPRTFEYDLALLRFYEPVVFQPNIIPVCVPENDENFIGQTAFVTGWGRLYEDGPLPSVLQEVAVPVINNTICESMYRAAGYIEHIPHIFICAGWKKGGYDSCEGDSGGPMVLQRESDKRFQLGGVISWGIGCAEANQPGVYTRISEFRDWVNQILQF